MIHSSLDSLQGLLMRVGTAVLFNGSLLFQRVPISRVYIFRRIRALACQDIVEI